MQVTLYARVICVGFRINGGARGRDELCKRCANGAKVHYSVTQYRGKSGARRSEISLKSKISTLRRGMPVGLERNSIEGVRCLG